MGETSSEPGNSAAFEYEVFLSFRGPDTRAGFTDFLYNSLKRSAVRVYRDDEELRQGEEIGGELLKAINQSKFSLPIFSQNYASSVWCLRELAQMVHCMKTRGQRIIPIFYDVKPSEVRYQTGDYGNAILAHREKKRYDNETIDQWTAALNKVGALKGFDLQGMINRREGEFTDMVTKKLLGELKKAYLFVTESLIGVDDHVEEIMRMIGQDKEEVQVVGIYGIGGVGKSTLAKVIYNQLSPCYDNCCFVANISEAAQLKGIEAVQTQMISDVLKTTLPRIYNIEEGMKTIKERLSAKKALVLLDGIEKRALLYALMSDCGWFGKGSRVIITTKNKHVITVPFVTWTYELTGMNSEQSLQLLSRHAFRSDYPPGGYVNQTVKAVNVAGGLPLVLEVVGSFLSGKSEKEWDNMLTRLEKVPHQDVSTRLKLSFDALEERQKQIFLDIACFVVGFDVCIARYMWADLDLFPEEGLDVLQQMSLVKIGSENKLWMHDQLRVLGREIVQQDCLLNPERQSRIWNTEQAWEMLISKKVTELVEALCLGYDPRYSFPKEELSRLSNVRFLQVISSSPCQNVKYYVRALLHAQSAAFAFPSKLFGRKPVVLSKLRWLSWHHFSANLNFNMTDLSLWNLVILDLSWSGITEKWAGWSHAEMTRKLRVLNLTSCESLRRMPDLSIYTSLERLILERCSRMVEVDRSIGKLKRLASLNLICCFRLSKLPDEMGELEALTELLLDWTKVQAIPGVQRMKSLENLSLNDCPYFRDGDSVCCSTSLERLSLERTGIHGLPSSIGLLTNLKYLSLNRCDFTENLPDSIGNLISLVHLDLSKTRFPKLPDSIGDLRNLKTLDMYSSLIEKLPSSIGRLQNLEVLNAGFCWQLEGDIPDEVGSLPSLAVFKLTFTKVTGMPVLPQSLTCLEAHSWEMKSFPDLSNLVDLRQLTLRMSAFSKGPSDLFQDPTPWWLGKLAKLNSLELSSNLITTLPADIALLTKLNKLCLFRCPNLRCIPKLPYSLSSLTIEECRLTDAPIDLSDVKGLKELKVQNSTVGEIVGLEGLENLRKLELKCVKFQMTALKLVNSNRLNEIIVSFYYDLIEIEGRLESLEKVELFQCPALEKFAALTTVSSKKPKEMKVMHCPKLNMGGGAAPPPPPPKRHVILLHSLVYAQNILVCSILCANVKMPKVLRLLLCPYINVLILLLCSTSARLNASRAPNNSRQSGDYLQLTFERLSVGIHCGQR